MYFLKNGGNVINAYDFFQRIVPGPVHCLLSLFIKPILYSLRVLIFTVVAYLHNIHCYAFLCIHVSRARNTYCQRLEQYHSFSLYMIHCFKLILVCLCNYFPSNSRHRHKFCSMVLGNLQRFHCLADLGALLSPRICWNYVLTLTRNDTYVTWARIRLLSAVAVLLLKSVLHTPDCPSWPTRISRDRC